MTANWPIPAVRLGSRSTAARVTLGAICFSSSGHFPLRLYSNCMKPVALPPGRAKLATRPAPTGSAVPANTIGTVRVACSSGATVDVPPVRERPGDLIGSYKLLEPIGEGGFGVVFLAEQTEPVRRKVALKVLKPGIKMILRDMIVLAA